MTNRLRRITIENFKGIGPEVSIDLKPVTLLFGANSAGKSTILHAIHFAHALLETGSPDIERTRLGGDALDLGGFLSFVHNHDTENAVVLGFEFEPHPDDYHEFLEEPFEPYDVEPEDPFEDSPEVRPFVAGENDVETIHLSFRVRWSEYLKGPIVDRYEVGANGERLARIVSNVEGSDQWIEGVNHNHPVLNHDLDAEQIELWSQEGPFRFRNHRRSALPYWKGYLGIHWDETEGMTLFDRRLDALLVGAGGMLLNLLTRLRYVGGLRQVPPRHYKPPIHLEEARWASGMGAWDTMAKNEHMRKAVSDWLSREDRLDTGYSLALSQYRRLPEEVLERLKVAARDSELEEVFEELTEDLAADSQLVLVDEAKGLELAPCDVGVGISQVVPVVAACVHDFLTTPSGRETAVGIVAIEQPKVHIHPRMQVALGDLFLRTTYERQYLIETHSEHLLLRILRRIRETADGELPPDGVSTTPDDVAVIYVEQQDGAVRLTPLRIDEDGEFKDRWPQGFFDERVRELM